LKEVSWVGNCLFRVGNGLRVEVEAKKLKTGIGKVGTKEIMQIGKERVL
jgi:hypothetical protein